LKLHYQRLGEQELERKEHRKREPALLKEKKKDVGTRGRRKEPQNSPSRKKNVYNLYNPKEVGKRSGKSTRG